MDFSENIGNRISDSDCDPAMVTSLVNAGLKGLRRATIDGITTPSEVVTASFTILSTVLEGVMRVQGKDERFVNAKEFSRRLNELIVEYGKVPS